jgi:hypothetical protein
MTIAQHANVSYVRKDMRYSIALTSLLLLHCSNTTSPMDGSVDAANCPGYQFSCYVNCTDLTPASAATCTNDAWQCPSADCACSAQGPAEIVCSNCSDAAATTYQLCDASSGQYECPTGTTLGSCPSGDASTDSPTDSASDAGLDGD